VASDVPNLNAHEARVFGVLIEKSLTTPEHYPLSLNAATTGANQKSNRDPVVDYLEAEVQVALQGLLAKHLAGRAQGAGQRTEKYLHNGRETLGLDDRGIAVLAELLMRGAQTAGELRSRAQRMAAFPSLEDLRETLAVLMERGFARRLPPAPGSRAERYAQCLTPGAADAEPADDDAGTTAARATAGERPAPAASLADRVASLEGEVAFLRRELSGLLADLGRTLGEPDPE